MKNQNKIKTEKNGLDIEGSYVIKKYRAGTKELLWESERIHNKIVNGGAGFGKNLVARALLGSTWVTVFPLEIDNASIGTGTTAPTYADVDLETPVVENILVALGEQVDTSEIIISFFIPDADLANGTYTEFALFCGAQMLARSLISPSYEKGSSEDTSIEYNITIT